MTSGDLARRRGRCGMNKKILITGGTGFIGSHLIEEIVKRGGRPIVLKRSYSSLWRISDFINKLDFYDLDKTPLENVIKKEDVDVIINLAVNYKKNHDYSNIDEMLDTNVKLPTKLLALAKESGASSFITAGSFFQYDKNALHINQETPLLARNFYAATKNALERILEFYRSSSEIKVFEFILFTPYGERDDVNKVIPYIIRSAIKDENVELTHGFQKLYPTYVGDIVSAIIRAAELPGGIPLPSYRFNITDGNLYSIREIVTVIEDILDRRIKVNWSSVETGKIDLIQPLTVDTSTTEKILGWAPSVSIEEGLKRTIMYYRGG